MTERVNHARDYIEQEDLSNYDGIVCVGGDGLCSEIVNGMLKYEDDCHQVKMTQTNTPIMLGIIPAGSTDTVSYCTSGTNDPVTATLNIILGRQLSIDICSVWQDGDFVKYSMSLMGYGYFGDVIKESENLQWLGPKRYDLAGFKRFMINRSYEGEVKFIKADRTDNDTLQCRTDCVRCSTFLEDEKDENDENKKDNWESTCGKFISVIGANMSCRCARSSTGISPMAHIGDGHIDLILIRKTTRAKYLQHLIKVSDKTVEQFDFNFIEQHRVKEFSFTPTPRSSEGVDNFGSSSAFSRSASTQSDTSVWNVDGELVEHPSLHIKVHRHLISMYASGVEE
jgi:ceramide kinase